MPLFPGGTYPATVTKTSWVQSQTGLPGLRVTVAVSDPEGGDTVLVGTIYFSERNAGMGRRQLKNLGFDPDTQSAPEIGKTVSLDGNEVREGVTLEEYKGELKVGFFGRKGGCDAATLKGLDAMLRAAKKGNEPKAAHENFSAPGVDLPAPKEDASSQPAGGDDDIPF